MTVELGSILLQCSLEAIVGLLHVELELSRLLVIELLGCSHLVQCDKPLDDLALVLKLLVCDLVDRLDDFNQQRVQCVLFHQANLDSVEEGNEGFGCVDNQCRVGEVALLGCRARWALLDCDGNAYAQSFCCSWTVKLSTMLACA